MNPDSNHIILSTPVHITSIRETILDVLWNAEHDSKHIEMIYVLSGNLNVSMFGDIYKLNKGDLIIIPDCPHRDIFAKDSPPKIFYIHFEWEAIKPFMEVVKCPTLKNIDAATVFEIKQIIRKLRSELGTKDIDLDIENLRLQLLLSLLYRAKLNATTGGVKEQEDLKGKHCKIVRNAKLYVEKNCSRVLSLEEIAASLNISSFFLSRIFNKENDVSLCEYINNVRLNESLKLLKEKKYSNAQVAEKVGFSSAGYFSKTFKKHYGVAPSRYKL